MAFEAEVINLFHIHSRGKVIVCKILCEDNIKIHDMLYDKDGNEYTIIGIEMINCRPIEPNNDKIIGLLFKDNNKLDKDFIGTILINAKYDKA